MTQQLTLEFAPPADISTSVDITKPLFSFDIEEKQMNGENVSLINARNLHSQLQVRCDYSTWIKTRLQEFSFIENQDFIIIDEACLITIDVAKHLAIVEENEMGNKARRYFLEVEKKFKESNIIYKMISHDLLEIPKEFNIIPDEFLDISVKMTTGLNFNKTDGIPKSTINFINEYVLNKKAVPARINKLMPIMNIAKCSFETFKNLINILDQAND